MWSLFKDVGGVVNLHYVTVLTGWCKGSRERERVVWILFLLFKEVLWECRCMLFKNKLNKSALECCNMFFSKL